MIKAIVFDMGGVVLNAKIEQAYEILSKKLSIDKIKFDKVKSKYIKEAQNGNISTEELIRNISTELNIDEKRLKDVWEESYSEVMLIDNNIINLVKSLKKNGYITALITNTIEMHSQLNKKRGVYSEFSPVILSNEVGLVKPQEEIYSLMLKKLNLKPDECIFIDDREEHLMPARKIGFNSILFKDVKQLKDELNKLGVKY